jgi:uncharacterized protein
MAEMNPVLEGMIQLQRAESELRRVQTLLLEIPRQKADLETQLAAERSRLEQARAALQASQKARRDREAGLKDLEGKRSKYKGQLMEVKTNKEYTAMLHEIEGVEKEIRGIEDQILVEMEKAESLDLEVRAEEVAFKKIEQRHHEEMGVLDQRARALATEAEARKAERDRVALTLAEDDLAFFERVAKLRGTAVAEARDGICQECHVKLRLQMYADLKRNETLMQCPQCNRILYYEPPVPVVVPEP